MYFLYGQSGIASIGEVKVSGAPGIRVPQLIFDVAFAMQPNTSSKPPRIVAVQGRLSQANIVIAPLPIEFVDWCCVPNFAITNRCALRAFVQPAQVRALDAVRLPTGSLALAVDITVQIVGTDGLKFASLSTQVNVSGSDSCFALFGAIVHKGVAR